MAEEIGLPPAMWFAERAVNTYMESAGPNYADKMRCLQALRISWSQLTDAEDLILVYLNKIERDLRDKAESCDN